ncbi:MAG: prepilin peptidase [Proteobacteria bacterium]|nr:prepilin peptidase [Pseudomonadota bacterium]
MYYYIMHVLTFIIGLCLGSFMNVCVYRLPLSKSIVTPRSMCPGCNNFIKFYDNIPVLSYIFLGGKCRNCNIPISFRYPMVEIISGLAALSCFIKFGLSIEWLVYFAFASSLIVITFIDIDHKIIPDVISLPGIPIGLLLASFVLPSMNFKESIIGILAGGGSLFAIAWIYSLITKKEGMGGGDIKLLAMIGSLTGWKGVLFTIFIASATGTLAGIAVMLKTKKGVKLAVPFGPFLSIGAILYILFGTEIISWYFNMLM